jgi:hypothetical protein
MPERSHTDNSWKNSTAMPVDKVAKARLRINEASKHKVSARCSAWWKLTIAAVAMAIKGQSQALWLARQGIQRSYHRQAKSPAARKSKPLFARVALAV